MIFRVNVYGVEVARSFREADAKGYKQFLLDVYGLEDRDIIIEPVDIKGYVKMIHDKYAQKAKDENYIWPEWVRPARMRDAYMALDEVVFNGRRYVSLVDMNLHSPEKNPIYWRPERPELKEGSNQSDGE